MTMQIWVAYINIRESKFHPASVQACAVAHDTIASGYYRKAYVTADTKDQAIAGAIEKIKDWLQYEERNTIQIINYGRVSKLAIDFPSCWTPKKKD